MHRRKFIRAAVASAFAAAPMTRVLAQSGGQVIVASWGGAYQDALREAIFKPFEKQTGIKVVEATGPQLPRIRAMVATGAPEWDVVDTLPGDYIRIRKEGLLQQIDYSKIDPKILADFDKQHVQPYAMGAFTSAQVIAFDTKKYTQANGPQSWADVWDVKKFPGPRLLSQGIAYSPEYALLADGAPMDKLYPLDLQRAYASFTRIKPAVVKWAVSGAMKIEALLSGEAVISDASANRVQALKEQGAPIDFVWDQALHEAYWWTVLKGAKNYANALKYVEFASRAETHARVTQLQPLGSLNKRAHQLLPPQRLKVLPTYPANAARGFYRNAEWWAEEDSSGKSNYDKNNAMWNAWITKG